MVLFDTVHIEGSLGDCFEIVQQPILDCLVPIILLDVFPFHLKHAK